MKNTQMIMIAVLVVAVIGGIAVMSNRSEPAKTPGMNVDDAAIKKGETGTLTPDQEAMEKKNANSRYVPYSKSAYDAAADKRRVLYFYATWCPSCKVANEDFTANPNKIPEDVVVIRTNYNDPNTDQEEKDLAKKYGITYQHTFVQIDTQGKEITKWNGGKTDELVAKVK